MRTQKRFSIFKIEQEEAYIATMAQKGYRLTQVDDMGYEFRQVPSQQLSVVIEFFQNPNEVDVQFYLKQGFDLICEYRATKGTWFYYMGSYKNIIRRKDNRQALYDPIFHKIKTFWSIIAAGLLLLALYEWMTKLTLLGLIFVIIAIIFCLGLGIFAYFLNKKKEI